MDSASPPCTPHKERTRTNTVRADALTSPIKPPGRDPTRLIFHILLHRNKALMIPSRHKTAASAAPQSQRRETECEDASVDEDV